MASTTVSAGSASIQYTATGTSTAIQATNPATGTLLLSTVNGTPGDATAQLARNVRDNTQLLQEQQALLLEQQARLDPNKSAAYNASVTAQITDIQTQISNTQSDIQASQDASASISAGGQATLDSLQAQASPPPTQDTAANQLTNNPPSTPTADATTPSAAPAGTSPVDGTALTSAEQSNITNQATNTDNSTPPPTTSKASEAVVADPAAAPSAKLQSPSSTVALGSTSGTGPVPDAAVEHTGPIDNPLLAYPSYTYGISLHMLTAQEYTNLVKDQNFAPNRVIVASAGRYNNTPGPTQFIRAPHFDVDFYFENLEIETVIGLNDHSRATNAINISFNIIEPYGITLFNRILKLTREIDAAGQNWTDQPYMLQIDFFASNDAGEIVGVVPNQTKRIPIKILKFNVKAGLKGAEYAIQASPYNHSAFDAATVSTQAHFEVVAGTVASFFQSNESEVSAIAAQVNNQRATQQNTGLRAATSSGLAGGVIGPDGQITYVNSSLLSGATQSAIAANSTGDPIYGVKSYGSAMNAWQKELKDTNKINVEDRYYFEFPTMTTPSGKTISIGSADFHLNGTLGAKDLPMVDRANTKSHRQGNAQIEILALDYQTKIFSINTGTSVEQVLNYVIRNSSYILDQLVVPEDFGADPQGYMDKKKSKENLPLFWYKIIPTVELGAFDTRRNCWARTITYHVVPYEVYNAKLSVAPQATWKDPVKEYNYIYTGLNVDVLDFEIEFNAMYYNAVTAFRNNISATSGMPLNEQDKDTNPQSYDGTEDSPNAIQPVKEKPQTLDARARATGGDNTPTAAAAVDVEQSLYNMVDGDMLQAKLKIVGDPMFIKQDDVFYPPSSYPGTSTNPYSSGDPRLINNGSLTMDNKEVYIRINYNSPSDIDENTGLMQFDSNYLASSFSGMYKLLTIHSVFSGGQFTQTMKTARLMRQSMPADKTTSSQRNVDTSLTTFSPPTSTVVAPSSTTTTSPTISAPTMVADTTAPASAPVQDTAPPVTTADQQALAQTAATAPEQTITAATEPPAVAPPPPPPPPLPAGVTQDPITGNYIYKGVQLPADRSGLAASMTAIDTNTTASYNYVDPVSGTVQTRTIDGATLNAANSPSGQLLSAAQTAQESVIHVQSILASNPTAYGTVAEGQQILAIRQAKADAAKAAYQASLSGS